MAPWLIAGVVAALVPAVALAHKWELPQSRVVPTVTLFASVAACLMFVVDRSTSVPTWLGGGVVLVGSLVAAAGVGLWRFYRDPRRSPPSDSDVIVSPADGHVVYVRRASEGILPTLTKSGRNYTVAELTRTSLEGDAVYVIGIALNFLDVHVNRSPVGGSVRHAARHPGPFASLKRPEAVFENERATIVVDGPRGEVAVVLIASRLVRRIVLYVKERDVIALGSRIGAIRFGSQADVVFRDDETIELLVEVGDHVTAGETILARYRIAG